MYARILPYKYTGIERDRNCEYRDIEYEDEKKINEKNKLISNDCYRPTGGDCSRYRNCVAKRYDCSDGDPYTVTYNYAVEYGLVFCQLYDANYNSFSDEGKQWVDKVRKCLQTSLVPHIKPWSDVTCEELELIAFNSHTACYLKPDG